MIRDKNNVRRAMSAAASLGVKGDDSVIHASSDEVVIPSEVIDAHPQVMGALIKAFQAAGTDWRQYIVGSPKAQKNPKTGAEMFPYSGGDTGFEGSPEQGGRGGRDTYGHDRSAPADGGNRDGGGLRGFEGGFLAEDPWGNETRVTINPNARAPDRELKGFEGGFMVDPPEPYGGPGFNPDHLMKATGILGPLGPLAYGLTQFGRHLATPNPDGTYGYTPDAGMTERNIERSRERGDPNAPRGDLTPPPAPPTDPGMPDYLQFPTDMTPQQQRAYIANMGLNSDDSRYTTDETQDYYKYLISSELQNAGDLSPLSPIEEQYLREVLGLAWTDYDDLMRQLSGPPAQTARSPGMSLF